MVFSPILSASIGMWTQSSFAMTVRISPVPIVKILLSSWVNSTVRSSDPYLKTEILPSITRVVASPLRARVRVAWPLSSPWGTDPQLFFRRGVRNCRAFGGSMGFKRHGMFTGDQTGHYRNDHHANGQECITEVHVRFNPLYSQQASIKSTSKGTR